MTASCALPALTGPPGGPGSGIFKLDILHVHVSLCMRVSSGSHRGQKRASHPPDLEMKLMTSHPTWVLGTETGSSEEQKALVTT